MSDIHDINGRPVTSSPKFTLTLEYEPLTGGLKFSGEMVNLDMTLNVLAQAARYFDARYRQQQAMIFKAEQERDAAIQRQIGLIT